jgi:hypothetical protein
LSRCLPRACRRLCSPCNPSKSVSYFVWA